MKTIVLIITMLSLFSIYLYPQYEFRERNVAETNINIQRTLTDISLGNISEEMLDSLIDSIMITEHISGTQALIVKHDEIVWSKNYGYANIEQNKPVEDSTIFLIGSISKPFVSTAIMQLWEDGLLDLDDNINDYLLPDFQVIHPNHPDDTITFFMLMTHTSGIRDNWDILQTLRECGDSPISLDSMFINYFTPGGTYYDSMYNFNDWAPGEYGKYDYTNVGAGLLAYIVEKLSGISFDQYCRENIFDPLDMGPTTTSWFLAGLDTNNIATPYDWQGGQYIPDCHRGFPVYPIGDLRTNKLNLEHFLSAFMNGGQYNGNRILDSATVDLILTDQLGYPQLIQGFLWYQTTHFNDRWTWGHFGGWYPGTLTAMFFHPEEDWGFIVFFNFYASDPGLYGICNYIIDYARLYGHIYSLNTKVDKPYLDPSGQQDTLTITTNFSNVNQHNFTANAIYISSDSTLIDSTALYDDGLHGDSLANDGLWGGYICTISEEEFFKVGISTFDLENDEYFNTGDQAKFTTAGPVTLDSVSYMETTGNYYYLRPFVTNKGVELTITNAEIRIMCNDPWTIATNSIRDLPDLAPGESVGPAGWLIQTYIDSLFPGYFNLKFEIMSDGWTYWKDSTKMIVGITENNTPVPFVFELKQNYPNPFNPSTQLKYSIPQASKVVIKVFDVLGNEIKILINKERTAGTYELTWNAANLPSGVYFYQLRAGSFVETKKMILLK